MIMGVITMTSSLAYNYNASTNESLSFVDTYNFTLTSSTNNNTIYYSFYEGNSSFGGDEFSILGYNGSIYYNNSSTKNITVLINYSDIGNNNISVLLFLNSTNSNSTSNKTFFIEVKQYILPDPEWSTVDIGKYELNVCNTLLPYKFEKDIVVGGNSGRQVNITTSEDWISSPLFVIVGSGNKSTVNINGTLPDSLSLGSHYEYAYFRFNSTDMESVEFQFNINDCGITLDWNSYIDDCDQYTQGTSEYQYCYMEAQAQYNNDWLNEFAQRNKTEIVNITNNVTVEVPVEVIRVNQTLKDLIDSASTLNQEMGKIRSDNVQKENKINELSGQVNSLTNEIAEFPDKVNSTALGLWNRAESNRKKHSKFFWFVVITLIIGGTGYGGYYLWRINNIY